MGLLSGLQGQRAHTLNCLDPSDALLQSSVPSIAFTTSRSTPGKSAAALLPPESTPIHVLLSLPFADEDQTAAMRVGCQTLIITRLNQIVNGLDMLSLQLS